MSPLGGDGSGFLKTSPLMPYPKGAMKGRGIERLREIMARLRGEGGCPWDRKQTFHTLRPFVIEEAYEVADAIDREDWEGLKEELGDLLFHIVFLSRVAEERGLFDIYEVIDGVADKMIRRHPHVFGNWKVKGSKEVEINWQRLKEREKGRSSILDGIPRALPALIRAHKITRRASRVGFDWRDPEGVMEKVEEELRELRDAMARKENVKEEVGDLLFSMVNLSRFIGVDPEEALHKACDRFEQRFRYIEGRLKAQGKPLEEASLEEMDKLWDEAKGR